MSAVHLEIYVEQGCLVCRRSERLAALVRERFPDVAVDLVDVARERGAHQHLVSATPTYILNGRLFRLGNPSDAELNAAIAELLEGEGS